MNVASRQAQVSIRAYNVKLDGARDKIAQFDLAKRFIDGRRDNASNIVQFLPQFDLELPIDNVNFARFAVDDSFCVVEAAVSVN